MELVAPEPAGLLAAVANVQSTLNGQTRPIEEWRAAYRHGLPVARGRPAKPDEYDRFIRDYNRTWCGEWER